MNKTYCRISAAMLAAGMMIIPSCSKKDPAPASSQAAPTTSSTNASAPTETQNTEESNLAPVLAYTGQLEVIAKTKSTWYVEGDAEMRYAVTDLDMNGRYEITAAKKTSFAMYEVTEDKSGIAKVEAPFEQGSTGPFMEEEYKLRVNKEGSYVYVAREADDTDTAGETTTYYYLVSLANGKITAEVIATEMKDADGNVRYGDDEFQISKEDFKQKTDTGLPAVEHIQKVTWGSADAVAGMNDAKAMEAICFKLTK